VQYIHVAVRLRARLGVVAIVAAVACRSPGPAAGTPEALAGYLETIVGQPPAVVQREAASWVMDEAAWNATVTTTYRPLHTEYQQAFIAALPGLIAQLGRPGAVTARRHYAGDPRLTLSQSRDRWALPPLFPSMVAEVAGAPIDAVFVWDGGRWRVLRGLDAVVRARVAALDDSCAVQLARAGRTGRCSDVGAAVAEAALRTDRDRLAHVCRLAEILCGKESP
jgi:hypothetical protein